MHNVVLVNAAQHFHQVDTLFICKHFMFVVEIKNKHGRLNFKTTTHHVTRTKSDGTVGTLFARSHYTTSTPYTLHIKAVLKIVHAPLQGADILPHKPAQPSTANHPASVPISHVTPLQSHIRILLLKRSRTPGTNE
ncbi:NERD domain-containing protein OS=Lysinibacillus sphaericus OX=1421 GN=LS41612_19910 PE=4 SV=1 [Lysinibacillus sphaericus]